MARQRDLFAGLSAESRGKLRHRPPPSRVAPMLATLTDEAFSDPRWVFERKLDGVRCLVFRTGRAVRLVSRNGKDMRATWPELAEALARQRRDHFVADGEIVAFEGTRTSFARLQSRIGVETAARARRIPVAAYLYLFDVLYLDGHDVTRLPLRDRKLLLKRALTFAGRVRYTPHRNADGEAYLREACAKGWEGLIAKDATAPYLHHRSRSWLKLKCGHGQELVVGGYTEPRGSRTGFGALLVGYYEAGALRYAGKVGTGYDEATLEALGRRLERLTRATSPFADPVTERGAHFVTPALVAEIGFTEWTTAGKLRHPRFLGLRTDKAPVDVRRERAQPR